MLKQEDIFIKGHHSNCRAPKLAKFDKAAEDVKDSLSSIVEGEEILEKRNFAINSIDAPDRDTVSSFLANVVEI